MQMIVFITLVACAITGVMCEDPQCDGASYNAETHICCEEVEIIPKPSNYQEGHKCCNGEDTYDPATQVCCNEKVYDSLPEDLQCCGVETHNPKEELCCQKSFGILEKVKKSKESDNKCCNMIPFDSKKEKCCKKTIKGRKEPC